MTDAEVERVAAVAMGCVDLGQTLVDEMTAAGMSASGAECFVSRLDDAGFTRMAMIAGMKGEEFDPSTDEDLMGVMVGAGEACLTPEEMGQFFGQ